MDLHCVPVVSGLTHILEIDWKLVISDPRGTGRKDE